VHDRGWRRRLDRTCTGTAVFRSLDVVLTVHTVRSAANHADAIADRQSIQSQHGAATGLPTAVTLDTKHDTFNTKHVFSTEHRPKW
jgi:hypothetical protein